jgi:hypothetical protein
MTLLADLEEFVRDHRPHGVATGDATEPAPNGYRLTVACSCVVFERWVTPTDENHAPLWAFSSATPWRADEIDPIQTKPYCASLGVVPR